MFVVHLGMRNKVTRKEYVDIQHANTSPQSKPINIRNAQTTVLPNTIISYQPSTRDLPNPSTTSERYLLPFLPSYDTCKLYQIDMRVNTRQSNLLFQASLHPVFSNSNQVINELHAMKHIACVRCVGHEVLRGTNRSEVSFVLVSEMRR